jgi:AcrR family transcriptional regulator
MSRIRREEQHASLREEIKNAARRLMAQQGSVGLSIRGIGREIELTAPALYHYYPSLDAVITDLILDAFNALADALEAARDAVRSQPASQQLLEVLLEYRRWALAHTIDFQLIYGNPIPGYEAPSEVTTPAATRTFLVIASLITRCLEQEGALPAAEYRHIPPQLEASMQTLGSQLEAFGLGLAPLSLYLTSVGWPRLHGIIMLELFNHIQPVVGDVDIFYRIQIEDLLRAMGVP